jgi:protein-tyrosine phosphatase
MSGTRGWMGRPLYFRPFLEAKAERCAAAVAAVAEARPGGVLVHCGIGRDRTGLVALALLALGGVAPADIADDHELSDPRLEPLRARAGAQRGGPGAAASLARGGTSAWEVIVATLAVVDVETRLLGAGLTGGRLRAVRDRLLEPAG